MSIRKKSEVLRFSILNSPKIDLVELSDKFIQ